MSGHSEITPFFLKVDAHASCCTTEEAIIHLRRHAIDLRIGIEATINGVDVFAYSNGADPDFMTGSKVFASFTEALEARGREEDAC